jgi:hypothetical protein
MQFNRVAIFIVAGAALLSACGDAATTGASTTALNLDSTSYATVAPTQSTLPPTTNATPPSEGEVTTEVIEYEIVAGDVPVNVAKKYGITLEALNNANLDTAGYAAFYVGLKIKIPAGAIVPGTATVPTTTVGATTESSTATTLAPSSGCTVGSHTIVEGDLPSTVAKQYDVTLDALNAANANTQGYQNFIVGVKIIIPCP